MIEYILLHVYPKRSNLLLAPQNSMKSLSISNFDENLFYSEQSIQNKLVLYLKGYYNAKNDSITLEVWLRADAPKSTE